MKKIPMDMMRKEYYTILTEKIVGSTKQQWYQSLFKQYSKKCMIILAILVLERLTH